jgi:hypothetical protein
MQARDCWMLIFLKLNYIFFVSVYILLLTTKPIFMKKILLVTVLVFAVIIANAQKKNVFKLNFVSPVLKTYNFQYERVLGEKKSFQLGFFYTGATAGEVGLSGFGITPEYRMYLSSSKEAPKVFSLLLLYVIRVLP